MDNDIIKGAQKLASESAKEASVQLDAVMLNMRDEANAIYIQAANQAAMRSKAVGREQALREAVAQMASKGVSAYSYVDKNGRTVHVSADVGVRRIINDTMRERQISQILSIADKTGVDLVEVSSTSNARKSHEAWQGKVYSLSGRTDGYEKFSEACHVGDPVNGIGGYNCGHTVALFHEGHRKVYRDPLEGTDYTTEQVRELTSHQRYLEREIRREKRVSEVMKSAGLDARNVNAKVRTLSQRLQELVNEHPDVLTRRKGYREATAPILRKRAGAQVVVQLAKDDASNLENLQWAILQRNEWAKRGLGINKGNQEKHIPGTHQYDLKKEKVSSEGIYAEPSYLTISYEECEELVRKYSGKGSVLFGNDGEWLGSEICRAPYNIGFYVDRITDDGEPGKHHATRYFKIIYSGKGVHIVPTNGRNS